MSLTKFLSLPSVKKKFAEEFPLPKADLTGELKAPPISNHYSLVGTAFDYLLRAYIQRLNPESITITYPLVAEDATFRALDNIRLFSILDKAFKKAEREYNSYLKSGKLDNEIMKSCLVLAQLDLVFRANYIDPNLGHVQKEDIQDLKNLISIVNPDLFIAKKRVVLNPRFTSGYIVGGADADLIIDNTLIEIKTVKELKFKREYYDQLIGYYILKEIGGIYKLRKSTRINRLGVYYSRHAILQTIPISTIEDNPNFKKFIEWFKKEAINTYGEKVDTIWAAY